METLPPFVGRSTLLPFAAPSIGSEEILEVTDTLRSTWITTGPKTERFEAEFRAALGAPASLALSSCTAALHTALLTLDIGPGDEVVTTPLTFIATFNVIVHVGATPVLADVEPGTLTLDPSCLERAITRHTRAVIPVHYAGHPVDLHAIHDLAERHGFHVIEDAAHAVGARYHGRWIGAGHNLVAFSFYATKNLTTAEGGMLTGDPERLARARVLSSHGITRDAWRRQAEEDAWRYRAIASGFKYNMTDIQASLGLCQLRRLGAFLARRRAIAARYSTAFAGHPALEVPVELPHVEHAWHLYVLRLRPGALRIDRDVFIRELRRRNIEASVHFIPVHLHPVARRFRDHAPGDFPVAYENFARMLSLPIYPAMTDEDVQDVIDAVLRIADEFGR